MRIQIVTGQSGAGKSTVLHALEDIGYYCVDNLPLPLLGTMVRGFDNEDQPVAVGVGAKQAVELADFPAVVEDLRSNNHDVEVLFLESSDDIILRRYAETRRLHPLGMLPEAITLEANILAPVRKLATSVIDTSTCAKRELRQIIRDRFTAGDVLQVGLMSFGFKNGLPSEADLVFDVRFLSNPFDVQAMRSQSGLEKSVSSYVLDQPDAQEMLDKIEDWICFHVPRAIGEGRSYLSVAIGCTGGQHRSVATVQALQARLDARQPLAEVAVNVSVRHRDLSKALHDTAAPKSTLLTKDAVRGPDA